MQPRTLGSLPVKSVGIALNAPIDARLDALWAIARGAGQPTSRQELVAALILAADAAPHALGILLNRYRGAAPEDAAITGVEVPAAPKRPGRRRLDENLAARSTNRA